MTVLETGPYARSLTEFGKSVAPAVIVVISAHWEEPGIQIAAGAHPPLIYDFGGFPQELYQITYDAPGSPSLAAEIAARRAAGISATGERPDSFPFVVNLRGVGQFRDLADRLQRRGYTTGRIEKILGRNFLNYAQEVWGVPRAPVDT